MSNGLDTCVQKYSGTTHVFTSRSKNDTIVLKAGNGETLSVDATIQSIRAPRTPIEFPDGSSINVTGSSISLSSSGPVRVTGTVNSTSITTGALIVSGGLAVQGSLVVGGSIFAADITAANSYADTLNVANSTVTNFRSDVSTIGSLSVANFVITSVTAGSLMVSNFRPLYNYNYEYASCNADITGSQVFATGTLTAMTIFNTCSTSRPAYMSIGMTTPSTSTVSITETGLFQCTANLSFLPDASFTGTLFIFDAFSGNVAAASKALTSGTRVYFSVSGIVSVSAATTLQCNWIHDKGSNFTMNALNLTSFTVNRIASI